MVTFTRAFLNALAQTFQGELPEVTLSEIAGVRYIHLDSSYVQGAMRIGRPQHIELEYVRRMMAWLLLVPPEAFEAIQACTAQHAPNSSTPPNTPRVLQLGLGAAALTKACHHTLGLHCTAVEINPQVVSACRRHFKLAPDGERLQVITAEAGQFVAKASKSKTCAQYLSIHIDLYDHEAGAPVLDSAEFYAHCRALLCAGGVVSVNLFGRRASFFKSLAQIQTAFAHAGDAVLSMSPTPEGNTIVHAIKHGTPMSPEALQQRAQTIETAHNWKATRWLRMLRQTTPSNA